jgi:hypothetical protein
VSRGGGVKLKRGRSEKHRLKAAVANAEKYEGKKLTDRSSLAPDFGIGIIRKKHLYTSSDNL